MKRKHLFNRPNTYYTATNNWENVMYIQGFFCIINFEAAASLKLKINVVLWKLSGAVFNSVQLDCSRRGAFDFSSGPQNDADTLLVCPRGS